MCRAKQEFDPKFKVIKEIETKWRQIYQNFILLLLTHWAFAGPNRVSDLVKVASKFLLHYEKLHTSFCVDLYFQLSLDIYLGIKSLGQM